MPWHGSAEHCLLGVLSSRDLPAPPFPVTSITTTLDLYGHLYPGDMDRCADRLDSAAWMADPAKIRPDDRDDQEGSEPSSL